MSKKSPALVEVVCALVLDAEGRIFAARRAPGQALAGHWEFPGGKLEPGESSEEALLREWQEEFGQKLRLGNLLDELRWSQAEKPFRMRAYWATFTSEELRPSVHDQWGFFRVEDLLERELLPADVVIFAKAEAALQAGQRPFSQG